MIFDIGHDDLRRTTGRRTGANQGAVMPTAREAVVWSPSCCAKAYTDGSTMSTSMGMEAISFSAQAAVSAARLFRRL